MPSYVVCPNIWCSEDAVFKYGELMQLLTVARPILLMYNLNLYLDDFDFCSSKFLIFIAPCVIFCPSTFALSYLSETLFLLLVSLVLLAFRKLSIQFPL